MHKDYGPSFDLICFPYMQASKPYPNGRWKAAETTLSYSRNSKKIKNLFLQSRPIQGVLFILQEVSGVFCNQTQALKLKESSYTEPQFAFLIQNYIS